MRGDAIARAAYVLHSVATGHPWANGNKRTAYGIADFILADSGYRVVASNEDVIKFMLEVAQGNVSRGDVEKWLRHNTTHA